MLIRLGDVFDELLNIDSPKWAFSEYYSRNRFSVTQDTNNYIIRAEVPGFQEKELHIGTRGNTLILSGKHEMSEGSKENYFVSENSSFERSYTLPSDVQLDGIVAEYRAGVLVLTLPKRKNTVSELKSVPIKALGPPSSDK